MNIVFMGTPDFSVPTLRALAQSSHTVQAVLTQPDRPRGRGKKLLPTPVKAAAAEYGIPVYQPLSLRRGDDAQETMSLLRQLAPDLIVVIAYGQILPKEILELPRFGCINLHASLLPRWRGAAPIQRAILAGDEKTGVTAMQMAEGLDTGDMLLTQETPIAEDETADTLHDRLAEMSADVLMRTLTALEAGALHPVPQDDALSCNAAKITKDMSRLDFTWDAAVLDRTVRAVTGYAMLCGRRVKLRSSVLTDIRSGLPAGSITDPKTLTFVCGDGGCVRPLVIQAEGAKAMAVSDFLRGFSVQPGCCFTAAE